MGGSVADHEGRAAGPVQSSITERLRSSLQPTHLAVINESSMHSVPPGSETHFKVVVVSERFAGKSPVERHRSVHQTLAAELAGGVHALTIEARTPGEWQASGGATRPSPECLGGSKADRAS